jgi:hypothetical protein
MIGFNGGVIGKTRSTSAQLSVPGVWTAREQLEAVRNNLWPGAAVVATGGIETTITVGGINYRVHTFLTSGTLTVTSPGLVQYLVVGGGGGGGGVYEGGGGGAGGLLADSVFLTGSQTITVGAFGTGGRGPENAIVNGTNGGNSSIGTLVVAIGGGRGAHHNEVLANSGGSGGGGCHQGSGTVTGGAGTSGPPVQGFAGGNGLTGQGANDLAGGGGGGAGGAGTTALVGVAQPAGGLGLASSIQTGSAITYAVGGNGSRRGSAVTGAAGTTNRGNGGGGSSIGNGTAIGANGGSGIVIIRYPTA